MYTHTSIVQRWSLHKIYILYLLRRAQMLLIRITKRMEWARKTDNNKNYTPYTHTYTDAYEHICSLVRSCECRCEAISTMKTKQTKKKHTNEDNKTHGKRSFPPWQCVYVYVVHVYVCIYVCVDRYNAQCCHCVWRLMCIRAKWLFNFQRQQNSFTHKYAHIQSHAHIHSHTDILNTYTRRKEIIHFEWVFTYVNQKKTNTKIKIHF